MKKELGIFIILLIMFLFSPWWVTFVLAVLSLSISPGYAGLITAIFIDVLYLPFSFPYVSVTFLFVLFLAHFFKNKLLIGTMSL